MHSLVHRIKRFHTLGIPYVGKFICDKCKNGQHIDCPGGTWCDCQHRIKENDND